MKQIKYSEKEILKFLRDVSVMSIATLGEDMPISSVVLFAVDDDFTIYFITHENTYKAKSLIKSPKISLSVWKHNKMMIQATGTAKRIVDLKEADHVMNKITEVGENIKDFWYPIIRIKNEHPYAIFKIKLGWLRSTDLQSKKITDEYLPYTELNLK